MYDIDPIKMVEQAVESATSTTNPIILNSERNVNTKFSDKDIRFSMRENVEETKDLIAVHNMRVLKQQRNNFKCP